MTRPCEHARAEAEMIQIDWGNLTPTSKERALVQERVDALAHLEGPTVTLRRRGARGYEAHLKAPRARPAELRLVDDDLGSVVERAVSLLAMASAPGHWRSE